jgi:hypothetical protein
LDQGTYYGAGATVPFFINKGSVWGDGNALYDDFKFFNKALTQEEVIHYYNLSLTNLPPPPPLVVIEPILHWDFETTWDNKQAVEFTNPYNIQLTYGKAVVNQLGPYYYLKANVPIELVSRFSKTLMFRFKSLPGFAGNTHFKFSTYEGNFYARNGINIDIVPSGIRAVFNGTNSIDHGGVRNLTGAVHAIPGGLSTLYDNFVHLVVVFDHTDFSITTYINGNINLSTIYVNADATQEEIDQGTYFGNGPTVPFIINNINSYGDAMALYDDIKFFNSVLTQEEVTHYYNESIA